MTFDPDAEPGPDDMPETAAPAATLHPDYAPCRDCGVKVAPRQLANGVCWLCSTTDPDIGF